MNRGFLAGAFLGLGLGGFLDGILLHQILQWHQMISAILPPTTLERSKINMFWDGIFHIGTWTFTVTGIFLLWRTSGTKISGVLLSGSMLFGWGLFNLLDSIFNHFVFGLHNVRENVPDPMVGNLGFFAVAILQCAAGLVMARRQHA